MFTELRLENSSAVDCSWNKPTAGRNQSTVQLTGRRKAKNPNPGERTLWDPLGLKNTHIPLWSVWRCLHKDQNKNFTVPVYLSWKDWDPSQLCAVCTGVSRESKWHSSILNKNLQLLSSQRGQHPHSIPEQLGTCSSVLPALPAAGWHSCLYYFSLYPPGIAASNLPSAASGTSSHQGYF